MYQVQVLEQKPQAEALELDGVLSLRHHHAHHYTRHRRHHLVTYGAYHRHLIELRRKGYSRHRAVRILHRMHRLVRAYAKRKLRDLGWRKSSINSLLSQMNTKGYKYILKRVKGSLKWNEKYRPIREGSPALKSQPQKIYIKGLPLSITSPKAYIGVGGKGYPSVMINNKSYKLRGRPNGRGIDILINGKWYKAKDYPLLKGQSCPTCPVKYTMSELEAMHKLAKPVRKVIERAIAGHVVNAMNKLQAGIPAEVNKDELALKTGLVTIGSEGNYELTNLGKMANKIAEKLKKGEKLSALENKHLGVIRQRIKEIIPSPTVPPKPVTPVVSTPIVVKKPPVIMPYVPTKPKIPYVPIAIIGAVVVGGVAYYFTQKRR